MTRDTGRLAAYTYKSVLQGQRTLVFVASAKCRSRGRTAMERTIREKITVHLSKDFQLSVGISEAPSQLQLSEIAQLILIGLLTGPCLIGRLEAFG